MPDIDLVPYTPADEPQWNAFVRASKNGTFLHERGFMDYHSDRFDDASVMVYQSDKLLAVLPAHRTDNTIYSHRGLSYGGLICGEDMKQGKMNALLMAYRDTLAAQGVRKFVYTPSPPIFHQQPADEDRYALWAMGATLASQKLLTITGSSHRYGYQTRRARMVKKARKAGVVVGPSYDLAGYWALLDDVLCRVHDAAPVHTLGELTLLQSRFPHNIRLYAAFDGEIMLAGVLMFVTARVAAAQYIAVGDTGRSVGALDLLFDMLLTDYYPTHHFLFGSSADPQTGDLNHGLLDQKEGFGGRTVIQQTFWLPITDA